LGSKDLTNLNPPEKSADEQITSLSRVPTPHCTAVNGFTGCATGSGCLVTDRKKVEAAQSVEELKRTTTFITRAALQV
jgi:hypothetical protein